MSNEIKINIPNNFNWKEYKKNNIFSGIRSEEDARQHFETSETKRIIYSKLPTKLENYKNIHKDQDIYVIGSGPSLDYIDKTFFDNKICIGVNQVYIKNINIKYLVRKECKLIEKVLKECNNNLIHFISEADCGVKNIDNLKKVYENYLDNKNIVVFKHNGNCGDMINYLPSDGLVVSRSTITSAIHLAAYMGAKNIILVGHDCGTLNNNYNTENYHTDDTLKIIWQNGKDDYIKWLPSIEKDTIKLREILKKEFNCNIYSLNPFINLGLEGNIYSKK